jgi:hypothetical protein
MLTAQKARGTSSGFLMNPGQFARTQEEVKQILDKARQDWLLNQIIEEAEEQAKRNYPAYDYVKEGFRLLKLAEALAGVNNT